MYNCEIFNTISEYVSVLHSKTEFPYIYPHIHNYCEIYYNISGAKGYMLNGVFYKCSKRDLIVIPKLSAHKVVIDKDFGCYDRCIVKIDDSLLTVMKAMNESLSRIVCDDENKPRKTRLSENEHREFMSLLENYSSKKTLGSFAEILSFLKVCFTNTEKPQYMDENCISHTDRIIMIIEKNFHNITVSQIAELAHCNSDYLNRVFKSKIGITVKRYLVIRKLVDAQKHLCLGKSIKEACYLSGFKNYSNFLRTFKKFMGYTPGKFEGERIGGRTEILSGDIFFCEKA